MTSPVIGERGTPFSQLIYFLQEKTKKTMNQKQCSTCLKFKPLDAFRLDNSKRDGHRSRCKECDSKAERAKHNEVKPVITEKICSKPDCIHGGKPQPISNFFKNGQKNDGYRSMCKDCCKKYDEEHRPLRVEYLLKYREENHEKLIEYSRNHYSDLALFFSPCVSTLMILEECRMDPNNDKLLQVRCKNSKCGKWFNPTNGQVQSRIRGFTGYPGIYPGFFYCSDECKLTCPAGPNISRKNNQNHVIGVEIKCTHNDALQNQLREMVFELDDYTCQKCGKSKEDYPDLILHCHHIIPFKADISLASDINNCITLCTECHNFFHNQTPECSYGNLAKI